MEHEQDLQLKLRIMRFLWYSGYFVRMNVDLSRFDYGVRASDITDIDVWGVRFQETFNESVIISDCKSGRRTKNTDRIFWLSGLMKTINSDRGIFYRARINESEYFSLAQNLNITPISSNRLNELENAYEIESKPFVGSFNESLILKERSIFDSLKEDFESKEINHYLKYRYWIDSPQRQIKMLIKLLGILKTLKTIEKTDRIFLQVYILSLFSVAILKFSKPILILPTKYTASHIKETIIGNDFEISERKNTLSSVYDFIMSELSVTGKKPSIKKEDFMEGIYPDYTENLVDLVQRVCLNPVDSIQIPRFLDLLAYEVILSNNYESFSEKMFSYNNQFEIGKIAKLAKNIIIFGKRAGVISDDDLFFINKSIKEIGINGKSK